MDPGLDDLRNCQPIQIAKYSKKERAIWQKSPGCECIIVADTPERSKGQR